MHLIEARRAYPGEYLYWRYADYEKDGGIKRCWMNGKARAILRTSGLPPPPVQPPVINDVPLTRSVKTVPVYAGGTVIERIERAFDRLKATDDE